MDHSAENARLTNRKRLLYALARKAHWLLVFSILLVLAIFSRSRADAGTRSSNIVCPAGYSVTVFADGLASPDGLALNQDGDLYVAEEKVGRVSRVNADGSVTPVLSGLKNPEGITFDDLGNLYVVEDVAGGRVVKKSAQGEITTLATGRNAPEGVTWAPNGNLYITESNVQFTPSPFSFRTSVTVISPGGDVTRVLTNTLFWSYAGVTVGPDGSLYVTNEASGIGTSDSVFTVNRATGKRELFASGMISPEGFGFSANGDFPLYVVEESAGADGGRLSRIEADGSHTPLCTGFRDIEDGVVDQAGRLYISEDGSGSIIRVHDTASISTTLPTLLRHSISSTLGQYRR